VGMGTQETLVPCLGQSRSSLRQPQVSSKRPCKVARAIAVPQLRFIIRISLSTSCLESSGLPNMPLEKDPNVPPQAGSRQGSLIGLQVFFIVIALIVYGLRIYTRRFILRSLGNDDYIMGVALVRIYLSLNSSSWQSSSRSSSTV
jgi:hypothetical protein